MNPKYKTLLVELILTLVLVSLPLQSWAISFVIDNRTSELDPDDPIQGPVYDAMQEAADNVEDEINNSLLNVEGEADFLKLISNSNAGANKGLGVDYASSPKIFVVGGSIQPSLSKTGSTPLSEAASFSNGFPTIGAALQSSAMLGLNMGGIGVKDIGPLDGDRLVLSMNFMTMSFDSLADGLSFDFMNFGLHGTYTLFEPKWPGNFAFKWSGVQLTSGFDYSSNNMNYTTDFEVEDTVPVEGASEDATIVWNPTLQLGVESDIFSIPIEFSTNIKLMSFLGFYAGLGADLNFGGSKLVGITEGDVNADYSGGDLGVDKLLEGDGILDANSEESVSPTLITGRFFSGVQLHFWVLKLFSQYSTLSNGTMNVSVGARIAF